MIYLSCKSNTKRTDNSKIRILYKSEKINKTILVIFKEKEGVYVVIKKYNIVISIIVIVLIIVTIVLLVNNTIKGKRKR